MGYVHPGSAPSGVFRISKGAGHVECEVRIDAPKALRGWGLERGVPSQLGEVWGRVGAKPGYCREETCRAKFHWCSFPKRNLEVLVCHSHIHPLRKDIWVPKFSS